ncbi:MAG TPA: hypothetical protein VFR67_07225 [Pilimelia sp.]|jgi:hypothetical protein|nr:hypothetical protein [Pilimelia sp.]
MSVMRHGDEDLHYSDNSHRWIAPADVDQEVWEAVMRAHLAQHLATMGGPNIGDERSQCRTPQIPRQRQPTRLPLRQGTR